eukprot:1453803-Rhodomonas_salina.1
MAIHLQDIKITARRARTIHDQLKRILPDYTAFSAVRPRGPSRRYNLGVMTLIRNDVAFTTTR